MATTYRGLTAWQWAVVVLIAVLQSLASTTGPAEFVGGLVVSILVFYTIARLFAMALRGIVSRIRGEESSN